MEYGYYPGCSLHGTAKEFDQSIRVIFKGMGIELKEVPDWNCCGASSGHATNEELALALAVRVLSQAEQANMKSIIAPCAACYSRLKLAHKTVLHDAKLHERINKIIGQDYKGEVAVKHIVEVLKENKDALVASIVKPLKGLKVVSYYGCLLARPKEVVDFDDAENPVVMDEIVTALGAEAVDWSHKTECCGAGFSFSRGDITLRLVGTILDAAKQASADVIAVACPLCHANLDMRQASAGKKAEKHYNLPIIYISQLVGLAQGKDARSLGLDKHIVDTTKALAKIQKEPAASR